MSTGGVDGWFIRSKRPLKTSENYSIISSSVMEMGFLTSSIGLQVNTDELMNTMPLRDTVAGDALSILWGSNTTLQFGAMGMRSPFARVSVLLSSNTEFRFSIQMASTGPSRTIQMFSPERHKAYDSYPILND